MSHYFAYGYALLIGVGETLDPDWALPLTVKDVHAIRDVLVDPTLCAYPQAGGSDHSHVRVVHDAGATRQGILDGLAWLKACAKADAEATVVVYFSGHGWQANYGAGAYYLIPHDVRPYDIPGSALAAEVFTAALREIPAKRLLVFVDSCHAEGMAAAGKGHLSAAGEGDFVGVPKGVVDDLARGAGRAVFTSSTKMQRSWFHPTGQLSLYTYHLLEAFQGAGNHPGDTVVNVSDLMRYLGEAVPRSVRDMGKEQTPFFKFETEDFPVALLLGGKGLPAGGWDAVQPVIPGITADRGSVAAQDIRAPVAVGEGIAAGGDVYHATGDLVIHQARDGGPTTGGIRARRIEAQRVVSGVLAENVAPKDAAGLVALARAIQQGGITADEIKAGSVVAGVLFASGAVPQTLTGLCEEVSVLRGRVAAAIAAGEIPQRGDAEDVQDALEKSERELRAPAPDNARVTRHLKTAAALLTQAAEAAQAVGKRDMHIFSLAPLVASLARLASTIFEK